MGKKVTNSIGEGDVAIYNTYKKYFSNCLEENAMEYKPIDTIRI